MSDRFSRIRKQYLSLGLGELAAVAVFAAAAFAWQEQLTSSGAVAALWFALVPLEFVLLQAGVYWLLARSWHGSDQGRSAPGRMPFMMARMFRRLKFINPIILLAGLIGVVANFPATPLAAVIVVLIWAFGVAEYVNYFVVRLSYPWTQWASEVGRRRTPRLVKDMHAAR